jgi:hypothetical protein
LTLNDGRGDTRSKPKLISEVALDVVDTQGLWVGLTESEMTQVKPDIYDSSTPMTGRVTVRSSSRWERNGSIVVKQKEPLPCTILSLSPEVTYGG